MPQGAFSRTGVPVPQSRDFSPDRASDWEGCPARVGLLEVPRAAPCPEAERDGPLLCRRCAAVEDLSPGGKVEGKSAGCAASGRVRHRQDLGVAETPKDCAPIQRDLDRLEP